MELKNHTPFAARLLLLQGESDEVQATVVVKSTYDIAADGSLTASAEQLPVVGEFLETPFGIFHGDGYVKKSGADLCVLATLTRTKPVTEAEVTVRVGAFVHRLRVTGPRRWIRVQGSLMASAPRPFTEMPLAYTKAYGGKATYNYEDVSHPDNPVGIGYYLTEAQAENRALPNIESVLVPPIVRWEDQPAPAGWGPYPMIWGLRARAGVTMAAIGEGKAMPAPLPALNNHAHPELVLPGLAPGDVVTVEGVGAAPLSVAIPGEVAFLEAHVGDRVIQGEGQPDGVFLFMDQGRITVTYRAHLKYTFRREELRRAHLVMSTPAPREGGRGDARHSL